MSAPKKIYPTPADCDGGQLEKLEVKGLGQYEYISVDALKAWINERQTISYDDKVIVSPKILIDLETFINSEE